MVGKHGALGLGVATSAQAAITGADRAWTDFASGFVVDGPSTLTGFQTGLTPSLMGLDSNPFVVGIASGDLLATEAPDYFQAPPGSIDEFQVCSTQVNTSGFSACNRPGSTGGIGLGLGETFQLAGLNIILPSAGTYWVYTRYQLDTFNDWALAPAAAGLFAVRSGSAPTSPGMFVLQAGNLAPSLAVDLVSHVPEPSAAALLLVAIGVGTAFGRRRSGVQP